MVSILIPAYNAEKTIQRCIDSVLQQTLDDYEVIVVDDGSTDRTQSILREYEKKNTQVKIISQENKGVASTRNILLDQASGEFILFVDADDWIQHDMLEKMINMMADADIVFCAFDNSENSDEVLYVDKVQTECWDQSMQLVEFLKHKRMTGMLWNKLVRKEITNGCIFNPQTGYGEDAEFLWQVLQNSKKMIVTNEILYHHTLELTSISHRTFSNEKYSAIHVWESVLNDTEKHHMELVLYARQRLVETAVASLLEIHRCGYKNGEQIKNLKEIVRKYFRVVLKSKDYSWKYKLYTISIIL